MTINTFSCGNEERRERVAASPFNGIDYLEVANEDQTDLDVFFVKPLSGPALTKDNIVIKGGVRVRDIKATNVVINGNRLTVTVSHRGDFSTYKLQIVAVGDASQPPAGYDPILSQIEFSFKVECPTEFDCRTDHSCPEEPLESAEIDYLAKDYARFRRVMLDRLTVTAPDWQDRNAADVGMAIVEALAYVADQLSYYQDAVATEAYLFTARTRTSVRRHARLLDYFVDEGANARTWVAFIIANAADGLVISEGTPVVTVSDPLADAVIDSLEFSALSETTICFETMHPVTLRFAHNAVAFHTWSDTECCLPAGSTAAAVVRTPQMDLKVGQVVVFEQIIDPLTGTSAQIDRSQRHAVRLTAATPARDEVESQDIYLLEWERADALPFALTISAPIDGNTQAVAVVRANIALADHGRSYAGDDLFPREVPALPPYRPELKRENVSFVAPWDPEAPASAAINPEGHRVPALTPIDTSGMWTARRDLLNSGPFARDFVAETETDGRMYVRFGDRILGAAPIPGHEFSAVYRIGNGPSGNIGPDALNAAVAPVGIVRVYNPLAAQSGRSPESIEQVRTAAPYAFRSQLRAVTEADWVEMAERHPEVQRAYAEYRWFGSWYTAVVSIDRISGESTQFDPAFRAEMMAWLDRFRIAGYDVELRDPNYVPLDIELDVCVEADRFAADVKAELIAAFSNRAFFAPDRFSFGDRVYLSEILAVAASVDGVTSVYPHIFQRWGKAPNGEIDLGFIAAAPNEVLRCDTDINRPENGRISFRMGGGL